MRGLWKRRGEGQLASRLERRRQSARPDFVIQLAREIRSTGRRRLVPARLLLAAALTLLMLVAVASVGGVSTAAAGLRYGMLGVVQSAVQSVKSHDTAQLQSDDDDDDDDDEVGGGDDDDDDEPDDDQYEEERRQCQLALYKEHRAFHRGQFTSAAHTAFHQQLREASEGCSQIGR